MVKPTADQRWMDEREPGIQPGLICRVEIDNELGKTIREVVATTAAALRILALQLEAGKLNDGFHPLESLRGEKIGEVFLDFHRTVA
jgi:hypothetical protein